MCSWTALVCCLAVAVVAHVSAHRIELFEGDACRREAGVKWTCKKLKDCVKAQDDLNQGIRPDSCTFGTDVEEIVCCQPNKTNSKHSKTYPKSTKTQTLVQPHSSEKNIGRINPKPWKAVKGGVQLIEGDACRRVAGVEWRCKKLKNCVKAQKDLKQGRRPESCNFIGAGTEAIVCCEPTKTNKNPPQTYPKPTISQKYIQLPSTEKKSKKCKEKPSLSEIAIPKMSSLELLLLSVRSAAGHASVHPQLNEGDSCGRVAGVKWICKDFAHCVKAQTDLKQGKTPEICSLIGSKIIVCCEPSKLSSRLLHPDRREKMSKQGVLRRPTGVPSE